MEESSCIADFFCRSWWMDDRRRVDGGGRGYFLLRLRFHMQPMLSVSELLAIAKRKLENAIQDTRHSSTTLASQRRCSSSAHNHIILWLTSDDSIKVELKNEQR